MILPSLSFSEETLEKGLKPDNCRDFRTIEQISEAIAKRRRKIEKKVKTGFF